MTVQWTIIPESLVSGDANMVATINRYGQAKGHTSSLMVLIRYWSGDKYRWQETIKQMPDGDWSIYSSEPQIWML